MGHSQEVQTLQECSAGTHAQVDGLVDVRSDDGLHGHVEDGDGHGCEVLCRVHLGVDSSGAPIFQLGHSLVCSHECALAWKCTPLEDAGLLAGSRALDGNHVYHS